jgi:hypothetical protein
MCHSNILSQYSIKSGTVLSTPFDTASIMLYSADGVCMQAKDGMWPVSARPGEQITPSSLDAFAVCQLYKCGVQVSAKGKSKLKIETNDPRRASLSSSSSSSSLSSSSSAAAAAAAAPEAGSSPVSSPRSSHSSPSHSRLVNPPGEWRVTRWYPEHTSLAEIRQELSRWLLYDHHPLSSDMYQQISPLDRESLELSLKQDPIYRQRALTPASASEEEVTQQDLTSPTDIIGQQRAVDLTFGQL